MTDLNNVTRSHRSRSIRHRTTGWQLTNGGAELRGLRQPRSLPVRRKSSRQVISSAAAAAAGRNESQILVSNLSPSRNAPSAFALLSLLARSASSLPQIMKKRPLFGLVFLPVQVAIKTGSNPTRKLWPGIDNGGSDFDWGVTNSIVQYSYCFNIGAHGGVGH